MMGGGGLRRENFTLNQYIFKIRRSLGVQYSPPHYDTKSRQ